MGYGQVLNKLLKLLAITAVIMTAVLACAPTTAEISSARPEPKSAAIRVSGAGGATSVLMGLADEYSKINSSISFKFFEGSGSSGGVKGVNSKLLDFGAMSRQPKASELESGIEYVPFAEERVAVVTSPDMQIPNLSIDQFRSILTGEIYN